MDLSLLNLYQMGRISKPVMLANAKKPDDILTRA